MQGLNEDDAIQPFHERDREAEPIVQQQVDAARAAEDQLHRDRAHKGRHDQRQHAERLDDQRAAELKSHGC
ncbi:hypothetical protein G6F31_020687 [Rhizopus arrhizus]|nr:hypothetical protein G6F31_020687 [Rhizopus arrhizus]